VRSPWHQAIVGNQRSFWRRKTLTPLFLLYKEEPFLLNRGCDTS
jgi:hypothetical protein